MADENDEGGADTGPPVKCPECQPGLPAWMGTFSDLVTLLLTFFVLLLSMAKTESSKYKAAMGSISQAFGGNVLQYGQVIQLGKSPENAPTMLDSQEPIKPFPIEFLTMEGLLEKHEINRESDEELRIMRQDLRKYGLGQDVEIYEMPEGIKVRVKDKILFKKGSTEISQMSVEVFKRVINLLAREKWTIFVEGHAARGEKGKMGEDALILSAKRATEVTRTLIKRGVAPKRVSTVFYGDSRPSDSYSGSRDSRPELDRRVEFLVRKRDLRKPGHKVDPHY